MAFDILLLVILSAVFIKAHPVFEKNIYNLIYLPFLLATIFMVLFNTFYWEIPLYLISLIMIIVYAPAIFRVFQQRDGHTKRDYSNLNVK